MWWGGGRAILWIEIGLKLRSCFLFSSDCGAEFTARSTLYVHAKRHNVDSASVTTFPCDFPGCNKKYSGKSNLRKHVVRCHGNLVKTVANKPPDLVRADTDPQQADYIALFLGDDEDQSAVAGRLTFVAVPAESLQVIGEFMPPSSVKSWIKKPLK